uniref:F-box domain-containing protein n=1 Tax=Setaria italica TaxID=4555 RepID=K3ZUD2_SETIT
MASPAPPISDHRTPPPLPALADEILEEIFVRLPTLDALAGASTACPSFHRITTDRSFLRRFRALHPSPLLGFVTDGFHAAEAPHPSTPVARALALAADFSYSFVPAGRWLTPWHPRDVRQGRVLLECSQKGQGRSTETITTPSVSLGNLDLADLIHFELFLAPTREDEEEISFRVICTASSSTGLAAFVFSSVTGQWHMAASPSWSSLGIVTPLDANDFSWFQYAGGCFHWMIGKPLIVLGRDRTPEVFFLADCFGDGPTDIIRITKQNGSGSSDAWQFENMISLPTQYNYFTLGTADGFLFLRGILQDENSGYSSEDSSDNSVHLQAESPDVEYFSLDVKTRECKKVCVMKQYYTVHSYFGYPPPLAKPTI